MIPDISNVLNTLQSTIVQELLSSGIENNEITDDNNYVVQQEGENVLYRGNSVHAVFNDIYSPMRDLGGSKPSGISILQEKVYVNGKLANFHVVTLGNGLIKLAQGRKENMIRLNQKLNELVNNESIKNFVKKSYKEARLNCKADENKTLKILKEYIWIPPSFVDDIRRSPRDELTA